MKKRFYLLSTLILLMACNRTALPKRFEGEYKIFITYYYHGLIGSCCNPNSGCNCLDTVITGKGIKFILYFILDTKRAFLIPIIFIKL